MTQEACTGCPPPEVCHTEGDGPFGVYQGDGSTCDPDPCPADPPGTGACCLEDACCVEGKTDAQCTGAGGMYKGDDSGCSSQSCAQPQTGACCLSDSSCVEDLNADQCVFANGVFLGTLYGCTPDPCGLTGACCMPNGDCVADRTSAQCGAIGGTYQNDGTVCDPGLCPEPTGACCIGGNTCLDLQTATDCEAAGGTYQGDSSTCGGLNCKVTGACCLPAVDCVTNCVGLCDTLTASACAYQGGGYAGDGSKCAGQDCSDCNDGPTVLGTCQTDERTQVVADVAAGDAKFGYAVSLSGDLALVGAPDDETFGSAYVINLGNADCSVGQTKLGPSSTAQGAQFGAAVAMSGDTAVVADPVVFLGVQEGVAYVFMKPTPGWGDSMVETATLLLSDPLTSVGKTVSVAINEAEGIILFGRSIDCEGSCSCDHSAYVDGCGSVYVYHRPSLGWGNNTEDFILSASDADNPDDFFGYAVSISGHTALVGAPFDSGPGAQSSGSAYIFRFDVPSSSWDDGVKLTACDANGGQHFGTSVSISGEVAVVGAPESVVPGGAAGSAYVFRYDPQSGQWHQEAKLTASDGAVNDQFGISVSISGDVAIIGAWYDDEVCQDPAFCNSGSAYVFRFDGLDWNEEARFNASDISQYDHFGISVSISGDRALVGAENGEAILGVSNSGAAYLFKGLSDCDDSQTTDLCDIINNPSLDCCPPHDCCDDTHGSGCNDPIIEDCVCNKDPDCCNVEWTAACVALVESVPCGTCDPGGNGIIDTCECCPADLSGDGDVGPLDLAMLLGVWGPCPVGCPEDLNFDCEVDAADLAILLGNWGPCPSCSGQAQWNGGRGEISGLRFAFGGGNGCLPLEDAVQMLGFDDVGAFIEWVLSAVPPDMVYQVAQFLLWLLDHWPC